MHWNGKINKFRIYKSCIGYGVIKRHDKLEINYNIEKLYNQKCTTEM